MAFESIHPVFPIDGPYPDLTSRSAGKYSY